MKEFGKYMKKYMKQLDLCREHQYRTAVSFIGNFLAIKYI